MAIGIEEQRSGVERCVQDHFFPSFHLNALHLDEGELGLAQPSFYTHKTSHMQMRTLTEVYVWPRLGYSSLTHTGLVVEQATQHKEGGGQNRRRVSAIPPLIP